MLRTSNFRHWARALFEVFHFDQFIAHLLWTRTLANALINSFFGFTLMRFLWFQLSFNAHLMRTNRHSLSIDWDTCDKVTEQKKHMQINLRTSSSLASLSPLYRVCLFWRIIRYDWNECVDAKIHAKSATQCTHTQPANLFQLNLAYISPLSRLFRCDALQICVSYTIRLSVENETVFGSFPRTCVMFSCVASVYRTVFFAMLITLSVPFHLSSYILSRSLSDFLQTSQFNSR